MKPARNWTAKVPDLIAPAAVALELETFLPYRLAVLASLTTQALAVVYASHGLSQSEWVVLAAVSERPQTSAKAIGATFHMQKAKVSRAVSALLQRKLVSGTPHRSDRRLVELRLTSQGEVLYRRCADAVADFAKEFDNALAPADRDALLRGLARLAQVSLTFKAESLASVRSAPPPEPDSQV
jgi:DNA-binding MarR family transcriptional regulator